MHIPDGFVSPVINSVTAAVSVGGLAWASHRIRKSLDERAAPLIGVTAAFIFAAQMLNFPVLAGASGHFLGAALAAILLGPSGALLILAVVLIIQCLGFADGGLTALGSNIFNMGIVGGLTAWGMFTLLRSAFQDSRTGRLVAAGVAAWVSVVTASAFAALELALSGTAALPLVLPAMVGVHAVIGVGEALITVGAYALVLRVRPDLQHGVTAASSVGEVSS